jgi:uncharacterized membrane protein
MKGETVVAAGLGAGASYFLDARSGRRRRVRARDKAVRAVRTAGRAASKTGRDAVHRFKGLALGGKSGFRHEAHELARDSWPPAIRFMAGAAGTGLILGGRKGGFAGKASSVAGTALLARALANIPFSRMVGLRAGRDVIDVQKTVHIDAPIDRVFQVFCKYEDFPSLLAHVLEVRELDIETGVCRWVVRGPLGIPVSWKALLTDIVHDRLLAWKTVPGSFIQHEGSLRFGEDPDGGTRVEVRLGYNPGLGALGHAAAKLLGADPKRRLEGELARMKTFIERGRRPRDAARKAESAAAPPPGRGSAA